MGQMSSQRIRYLQTTDGIRLAADLEAVVEAADARAPFTLLGISQGAAVCVAYAVRHPELCP